MVARYAPSAALPSVFIRQRSLYSSAATILNIQRMSSRALRVFENVGSPCDGGAIAACVPSIPDTAPLSPATWPPPELMPPQEASVEWQDLHRLGDSGSVAPEAVEPGRRALVASRRSRTSALADKRFSFGTLADTEGAVHTIGNIIQNTQSDNDASYGAAAAQAITTGAVTGFALQITKKRHPAAHAHFDRAIECLGELTSTPPYLQIADCVNACNCIYNQATQLLCGKGGDSQRAIADLLSDTRDFCTLTRDAFSMQQRAIAEQYPGGLLTGDQLSRLVDGVARSEAPDFRSAWKGVVGEVAGEVLGTHGREYCKRNLQYDVAQAYPEMFSAAQFVFHRSRFDGEHWGGHPDYFADYCDSGAAALNDEGYEEYSNVRYWLGVDPCAPPVPQDYAHRVVEDETYLAARDVIEFTKGTFGLAAKWVHIVSPTRLLPPPFAPTTPLADEEPWEGAKRTAHIAAIAGCPATALEVAQTGNLPAAAGTLVGCGALAAVVTFGVGTPPVVAGLPLVAAAREGVDAVNNAANNDHAPQNGAPPSVTTPLTDNVLQFTQETTARVPSFAAAPGGSDAVVGCNSARGVVQQLGDPRSQCLGFSVGIGGARLQISGHNQGAIVMTLAVVEHINSILSKFQADQLAVSAGLAVSADLVGAETEAMKYARAIFGEGVRSLEWVPECGTSTVQKNLAIRDPRRPLTLDALVLNRRPKHATWGTIFRGDVAAMGGERHCDAENEGKQIDFSVIAQILGKEELVSTTSVFLSTLTNREFGFGRVAGSSDVYLRVCGERQVADGLLVSPGSWTRDGSWVWTIAEGLVSGENVFIGNIVHRTDEDENSCVAFTLPIADDTSLTHPRHPGAAADAADGTAGVPTSRQGMSAVAAIVSLIGPSVVSVAVPGLGGVVAPMCSVVFGSLWLESAETAETPMSIDTQGDVFWGTIVALFVMGDSVSAVEATSGLSVFFMGFGELLLIRHGADSWLAEAVKSAEENDPDLTAVLVENARRRVHDMSKDFFDGARAAPQACLDWLMPSSAAANAATAPPTPAAPAAATTSVDPAADAIGRYVTAKLAQAVKVMFPQEKTSERKERDNLEETIAYNQEQLKSWLSVISWCLSAMGLVSGFRKKRGVGSLLGKRRRRKRKISPHQLQHVRNLLAIRATAPDRTGFLNCVRRAGIGARLKSLLPDEPIQSFSWDSAVFALSMFGGPGTTQIRNAVRTWRVARLLKNGNKTITTIGTNVWAQYEWGRVLNLSVASFAGMAYMCTLAPAHAVAVLWYALATLPTYAAIAMWVAPWAWKAVKSTHEIFGLIPAVGSGFAAAALSYVAANSDAVRGILPSVAGSAWVMCCGVAVLLSHTAPPPRRW